MEKHPKVFISYSWSPDENKEWVLKLAKKLNSDGVNVIIDKWNLKPGQDKNKFMEQIITDPTIEKVLLIINKDYAEKADLRKGGVGIECDIISEEIYGKADQTKFIPIVREYTQEGKAIMPVFAKSRAYIDLSSNCFKEGYDYLLKVIYNNPIEKRPPIGRVPLYSKENQSDSSTSSFRNIIIGPEKRGKRILLIEDSGEVAYDIKNELSDCNYEVKHADSYLSARGMWKRYDGIFDCIILDLNINPEGLPPENSSFYFPTIGLAFLKEIKWNENLAKDVKIIIYSAYITEFKVKCSQNNIPYSSICLIEKSGTSFRKLIDYIKTNV